MGPKAGRDKTPGPVEKGGIKMEGYGTMHGAAMACMTASLLIAFGLPLGLGLFFRRRGGRWRAPWCCGRQRRAKLTALCCC